MDMGKPMSTVYVPDEYGRLVPTQVPTWIGFIGWYAGPEPPEGYLYCDGSAIGRETYSELFEVIGTLYGAGDGAETFNLPDARGIFFRGDGGENNAAMGTRQGDAIRNFISSFDLRGWASNDTANAEIGTQITANGGGWIYEATGAAGSVPCAGNGNFDNVPNSRIVFDPSKSVPTVPENRPINMAFKPCIHYV